MVRVLLINQFYSPNISGGAEVICQEQAEKLAQLGYHVAVLVTNDIKKGLIKDSVNGLTVYRAETYNKYWAYNRKDGKLNHFIWHFRDIYNKSMTTHVHKIIEIEKPDVVICHALVGWSVSVWGAIKKHNIPIIQVLHDQYLRCPKVTAFSKGKACTAPCIKCRLMRFFHKRLSSNVDAVIGVSEYVLNSHIYNGYFNGCKKYVIHNAIEIPTNDNMRIWDGTRTLRIGYIGTIVEAKGVELLINTFKSLSINAHLYISGKFATKEYESKIRNLAFDDKRITFCGYVKPIDHYSNIDVNIVPSLWPDTFPTVAFESCANNVPVICSNSGGLPEIVKNGLNGLVYDVNNANGLACSIMKIYEHKELLNKMKLDARKSVTEMLDTKQYVEKYVNIIESILK